MPDGADPANHLPVALRTLCAPIVWGSTYITVTELLPDGRPLLVAFLRLVPAGVLLAGLGWVRARWVPRGVEWLRLMLAASLNFGLFFPLLIVAVYRLPGGVAAAVGGIQPLLVATINRQVFGEPVRRSDLAVGLVAAIGVALVVVRPGAGIDPLGVLAALGANVAFAFGALTTKHLAPPRDRLSATGYQMLLAAVAIAPIALAVEGRPPSLTAVNMLAVGYLSLVATGLTFVLWFSGIAQLPMQAVPVLGLAAPVSGATLGWVLLDQQLAPLQLIGMAVTIGAIVYASTVGARSTRPTHPWSRTTRRPDPAIDCSHNYVHCS